MKAGSIRSADLCGMPPCTPEMTPNGVRSHPLARPQVNGGAIHDLQSDPGVGASSRASTGSPPRMLLGENAGRVPGSGRVGRNASCRKSEVRKAFHRTGRGVPLADRCLTTMQAVAEVALVQIGRDRPGPSAVQGPLQGRRDHGARRRSRAAGRVPPKPPGPRLRPSRRKDRVALLDRHLSDRGIKGRRPGRLIRERIPPPKTDLLPRYVAEAVRVPSDRTTLTGLKALIRSGIQHEFSLELNA